MNMEKVPSIEFHITDREFEDFIVRAAKLVEEGYKVSCIRNDGCVCSPCITREPFLHITFIRGE